MLMYYALVLITMIGAGFFYGPILAKWAVKLWRIFFGGTK
jgi:hypothetical protein